MMKNRLWLPASRVCGFALCAMLALPLARALTEEDLHGPVFRPDYIETAAPDRTIPEYGQVDKPYVETVPRKDWQDNLRATVSAAKGKAPAGQQRDEAALSRLREDYLAITKGIEEVDVSDIVQSKMIACGPTAVPFLYHPVKGLIGVAGRVGQGRFALLGHNGILHKAGSDRKGLDELYLNLARWCGGKEDAVVGVLSEEKAVIADPFRGKVGPIGDLFRGKGLSVKQTTLDQLDDVDVLFFRNSNTLTRDQVAKIAAFVEAGKGFVVADTSWALMQSFDEYPIHRVTRGAGVFFTKQESWDKPGVCEVPTEADLLLNLWYSIDRLRSLVESANLSEQERVANVLGTAAATGASFPGVQAAVAELNLQRGLVEVTNTNRLDKTKRPLDSMLTRHQCRMLRDLQPEEVPAHPSAANWPGLPEPGATRLSRTLTIDGNTPSASHGHSYSDRHVWRMTGLYARPGEVITVAIPETATDVGLQVQVGIHTDTLGPPSVIRRPPEILLRRPLTAQVTRVANAFGGLVAILVPPDSRLGDIRLTVSGAIEAPYYVHGKTGLNDWQESRRNAPGAWGYLSCSGIIVFVPHADLVALDRPDHVMRHWETAIHLMDRLAGMEGQRRRPEMAVPDIQISYGGAYAGYPYVTGWSGRTFISPNTIKNGSWGDYHELGHTFQSAHRGNFKFVNGEVDVNWYPFYVCEKLHGRPNWRQEDWPHSTTNAASRVKGAAEFLAGVKDGTRYWDGGQWHMGLYDFYWQLKNAFGWELFETVNTRMYAHAKTLANPTLGFVEKRDLWLQWACETSGCNLVPYFEMWGHRDISEGVKQATAKLPVWTANRAPSALTVHGLRASLPEDASKGTDVCRFGATDPDPGNRLRYVIEKGNEDGAFALNYATGHLRVLGLDYERTRRYELTVAAADSAIPSLRSSQTVVVDVENRAEPPAIADQALYVRGPITAGQAIGAVSATPDTGKTPVFALVGGDSLKAFTIDKRTGLITVAESAKLPGNGHCRLHVCVRHDGENRGETADVDVHYGLQPGARREVWTGVDGSDIESLTGSTKYSKQPDVSEVIDTLDTPEEYADSYGQRITALLIPPADGAYTFWIASDDGSELQLSDGTSPDGLKRIAHVRGWAGRHAWNAQGNQKSRPILLRAGQPVLLRALHKEGGGGDHLAVAWQGPGIEQQILDSRHLVVPPTD